MPDLKKLMEINAETKEILTEPYQPILIGVKQEQWNALVRHITTMGAAVIENTALISKLPTQEGVDSLMENEIRRHNSEMENDMSYQTKRLNEIITAKLTEAERNMQATVSKQTADMIAKLQARDLSPEKLKVKWVLIGAILPSALLLWQLLSNLW